MYQLINITLTMVQSSMQGHINNACYDLKHYNNHYSIVNISICNQQYA